MLVDFYRWPSAARRPRCIPFADTSGAPRKNRSESRVAPRGNPDHPKRYLIRADARRDWMISPGLNFETPKCRSNSTENTTDDEDIHGETGSTVDTSNCPCIKMVFDAESCLEKREIY